MGRKKSKGKPKLKASDPRPTPTHFLCFPLLTPTSKPQLERSLARFRELVSPSASTTSSPAVSSIAQSRRTASERQAINETNVPSVSSAPEESIGTTEANIGPTGYRTMGPIIPPGAYRPLGTLHLTLGVMHLASETKLEAALQLLRELPLGEMLRDAGDKLAHYDTRMIDTPDLDAGAVAREAMAAATLPQDASKAPPMLNITLHSLSAFPRAAKATVLHAVPYDPTARLQHFALALLQTFVDAGFVADETQRKRQRGLVLHATIANTVYVKSEKERSVEVGGRGRGRVTIDARDLVREMSGMVNQSDEGNDPTEPEEEDQEDSDRDEDGERNMDPGEEGKRETEEEIRKGAFVWAKDVLIDRVQICKMRAREVEDRTLGMEYEVVGEQQIFLTLAQTV